MPDISTVGNLLLDKLSMSGLTLTKHTSSPFLGETMLSKYSEKDILKKPGLIRPWVQYYFLYKYIHRLGMYINSKIFVGLQ